MTGRNVATKVATISVVGGGAVGQAVAAYYTNTEVKTYDKYLAKDSISEAAAADNIFVAVPTPYENGQDLKEMDDAIANIVEHLENPQRQVIILKSTVLPGTTDRYQELYPNANFVFNPEFLTESVATEDFAKPDKQLVGFTKKTKAIAEQVLEILPDAPYKKILPAGAAETVKYAINSFYGLKVIFGNAIYDFCEKLGFDYDTVRAGLTTDTRIIDSHFDVFHGGFRGYGGKCLPKDIRTFAHFSRTLGQPLKFIEKIIEINDRLTVQKR